MLHRNRREVALQLMLDTTFRKQNLTDPTTPLKTLGAGILLGNTPW